MLSWEARARPKQLEPDTDWLIWLIMTGRGWGKNTTGANTVIKKIKIGEVRNIGLIAPTAADVRDYMIDEAGANSGIFANSTSDFMPRYVPSKRRVEWPNGAIATAFSAEDPDQLRGPNHDLIWADELASWKNREETWNNAMFTLRRGKSQCIITTTPRPLMLLKQIMRLNKVVITRGSTYENINNLSDAYIQNIIKPYEGTALGRQELQGDILEENSSALFDLATIDKNRIKDILPAQMVENCELVVVGVDPTGSKDGNGVGITIGGRWNNQGYLLGDYSLKNASPNDWALKVIEAYDDFSANYVVVEKNFGGEMVANTIRLVAAAIGHTPVPIREVFASRGKNVRAQPISGLVQQGKIHHVGEFNELEDQLTTLENGETDDIADSYVWTFTDLLGHIIQRFRPQAGDAKGYKENRKDGSQLTVVGNIWDRSF